MPRTLKTTAAAMVADARAKITEIDADAAIALAGDERYQFIDIRDIRERQKTGWVPGSFHCPRGMTEFWIDPESPYFNSVFDQDKTYILYCAAGWRSALTAAMMQEMGFEPVAHITDGFASWMKADGPVEAPESPAPGTNPAPARR